jgi:hypothetical protein
MAACVDRVVMDQPCINELVFQSIDSDPLRIDWNPRAEKDKKE